MSDILPFLKSLMSVSGLSGHEVPAADLIHKQWTPLTDEIHRSKLGSLHALKKGSGKEKRPSLMLMTHMDAIGMMVTRIHDGFLHITQVGGVDPRVLPGTPVTIHATKSGGDDLYGVMVMPPANLLPEGVGQGAVGLRYLLVETGLTPAEVVKRVNVGDLVSFATDPIELSGGYISGHSLDNRASVAALTLCLEELNQKNHLWDVWAVASTQEEETFAGAYTSTHQIKPDIAVAIDVTFGKGPGANGRDSFPLGKGITLGVGASLHPFLHKRLKETAERFEIPVKNEMMAESTYTDADAIHLSREGVPTMVISIPLRYMHTPVEMIAMKDIQRAGRLLAEFAASLESDFINRIVWD